MNKNILIAVGITILFLGLAIQPSIAVKPIISDNEDDCNICPKVSKTHLVGLRSLINSVETLDNKLSVVPKLIPEVEEEYQELSDSITTLIEMNKELNSDRDYPIICSILTILLISFLTVWIVSAFSFIIFEKLSIISNIFIFIINKIEPLFFNVLELFMDYDCHP